jgi:phosphopantetheinyl transferase (holo-ACP synthase)
VIYGIGADIAEISRFQSSYERFGLRLVEKILNFQEAELFCSFQK